MQTSLKRIWVIIAVSIVVFALLIKGIEYLNNRAQARLASDLVETYHRDAQAGLVPMPGNSPRSVVAYARCNLSLPNIVHVTTPEGHKFKFFYSRALGVTNTAGRFKMTWSSTNPPAHLDSN